MEHQKPKTIDNVTLELEAAKGSVKKAKKIETEKLEKIREKQQKGEILISDEIELFMAHSLGELLKIAEKVRQTCSLFGDVLKMKQEMGCVEGIWREYEEKLAELKQFIEKQSEKVALQKYDSLLKIAVDLETKIKTLREATKRRYL